MKTIASDIQSKLFGDAFVAVTLQGGYAVRYDSTRLLFQPYSTVLAERRNKNGRCTRLDVAYKDGSKLRFTYNPRAWPEFKYEVLK